MPRFLAPNFAFGGLNTKAQSTGLDPLSAIHLQDMRVVGRDLVQRKGMVRLAQIKCGEFRSMDFDGTNQEASAPIDTRVWALGTTFSLEIACDADTLADDEAVLTAGSTTPCITVDLSSSKWRVRIVDSAAATTTLTSTTNASTSGADTLQVVRDGADLTLRLNNTSEDTDTMSATNSLRTPVGDLRVARSGGSDFFDGSVDYVRLCSKAKANHNDRLLRSPCPRAADVLADYDFQLVNTMVRDRSRYENHLVTANTPVDATSLCHNPAFMRVIGMGVDENNRRQLLLVEAGCYYLATVA